MKLTEIQARALSVLKDKGPLYSACVGEEIWPDRQFKSSQGAGLAGGGVMGKLRKKGLVRMDWPRGWVLTVQGRVALEAHA